MSAKPDPIGSADTLTPVEIAELLGGLSVDEWCVLHRSASALGSRVNLSGSDILQEPCLRMLQGKRRCQRHLPFRWSIQGVMRSLVSAELEALEGERRPILLPPEMLDQRADDRLSPENVVIDGRADRRVLDTLMHLIDDDPGLVALAEGRCDGLSGEALRRHLNVTERQLATLKRRLSLRIADLLKRHRAGETVPIY